MVIDFLLTLMLTGGARLGERLIVERPQRLARSRNARGVLVVGAGSGGQMVVRELQLNPKLGAPRHRLRRRRPAQARDAVLGLKVLGSTDEIGEILDRRPPTRS